MTTEAVLCPTPGNVSKVFYVAIDTSNLVEQNFAVNNAFAGQFIFGQDLNWWR